MVSKVGIGKTTVSKVDVNTLSNINNTHEFSIRLCQLSTVKCKNKTKQNRKIKSKRNRMNKQESKKTFFIVI